MSDTPLPETLLDFNHIVEVQHEAVRLPSPLQPPVTSSSLSYTNNCLHLLTQPVTVTLFAI